MDVIPFVDAHVHLWDLRAIRYPWLTPPFDDSGPNGSTETIAHDYLLDDYLADAARWDVQGIVHVDAGADPAQALDETIWLEKLAHSRGLPSAIIAYAPLDDPDVDALLEQHAAHPHVRGIRQIVNWHADPKRTYTASDLTRNDAWRAGFGKLARHGLSFDLQCYPDQMADLAPLIARHSDVPVIVNHMGMAVPSDPDGLAHWWHGMRTLAQCPHVSTKLSGVGFIDRNWQAEDIRPYILEAIEIFGPDRCMFASNSPTDKLFAPIDTHLEAYHAIVSDFSLDERRAMFGGNASRVYRLGLDL